MSVIATSWNVPKKHTEPSKEPSDDEENEEDAAAGGHGRACMLGGTRSPRATSAIKNSSSLTPCPSCTRTAIATSMPLAGPKPPVPIGTTARTATRNRNHVRKASSDALDGPSSSHSRPTTKDAHAPRTWSWPTKSSGRSTEVGPQTARVEYHARNSRDAIIRAPKDGDVFVWGASQNGTTQTIQVCLFKKKRSTVQSRGSCSSCCSGRP